MVGKLINEKYGSSEFLIMFIYVNVVFRGNFTSGWFVFASLFKTPQQKINGIFNRNFLSNHNLYLNIFMLTKPIFL